MTLTVSGIGETGPNIGHFQLRKVLDDLIGGHAISKPTEDVVDGDAHASDYRATTALTGLNRDSVVVFNVVLRYWRNRSTGPRETVHPERPLAPRLGLSGERTSRLIENQPIILCQSFIKDHHGYWRESPDLNQGLEL